MKILHTADWHIGKTLYKHSLVEEIKLFFDWLMKTVEDQKIDIVLVSGDIFDLANPSNADKELYYQILSQLKDQDITTIITAGNHDSPSLLEAPRQLLQALNIHVVGHGSPKERQLITVPNKEQGEQVAIIATPYLREGDIRRSQAGQSYDDKISALRTGISDHYQSLKDLASKLHGDLPVVAMGHLYMQGADLSTSEREIQIGNLAGLSTDKFEDLFDYMALGHIHRPQKMNKTGTIRYSGSPIALSFSERKDLKKVIILEISEGTINQINELDVPVFRSLDRIEGTLEEVRLQLDTYRSPGHLPSLLEINILEKERDQSKILDTIALAERPSPHYVIINYRISFEHELSPMSGAGLNKQIEDLHPRDVFMTRIDQEELDDKDRKELIEAFDEVLALATHIS